MLKTEERQKLIRQRGCRCENCGLTEWMGQPIKLEVHHLDGNRLNDDLNNLQVLCPNCHSYTENHSKNVFNHSVSDEELLEALQKADSIHRALITVGLSTAGKNYARARKIVNQYELSHLYKKNIENFCIDCGAPITKESLRCGKCNALNNRVAKRPNREQLKQLIRTTSFLSIGKQFNVSDNAVRKWCDSYNLPRKKEDIKNYSDEEWGKI
jgi:Zn finger protein HypA/HybF involved in hydrogenase expression